MPPASAVQKIVATTTADAPDPPRCQDKYTRASAPIAAVTVRSSRASVLARRASAPSSTEAHIISAAARRRAGLRRPAPSSRSRAPRRWRRSATEHGRARCAPAPAAGQGSGFDGRGLQPVDPDRLLVADVVLEADIDEPPVSTICLVAWANRASSRSIGGMVKNPGRKNSRPHRVRNAPRARDWRLRSRTWRATCGWNSQV